MAISAITVQFILWGRNVLSAFYTWRRTKQRDGNKWYLLSYLNCKVSFSVYCWDSSHIRVGPIQGIQSGTYACVSLLAFVAVVNLRRGTVIEKNILLCRTAKHIRFPGVFITNYQKAFSPVDWRLLGGEFITKQCLT